MTLIPPTDPTGGPFTPSADDGDAAPDGRASGGSAAPDPDPEVGDGVHADADAEAPARDSDDGGTRSSPSPTVAWVLAFVAVLVAAAALGLFFLGTPPEEQDRREIVQVSSDTLMAVTNWEAGELDVVRAELAEIGTEQLQQEATQILDELAEQLAAAGAQSSGDVLELIAEVDRDEGVAVGIVRQELRSAELGTETTACWGVRVVTVRTEGRWMAERLDIVGPGECPAGSG